MAVPLTKGAIDLLLAALVALGLCMSPVAKHEDQRINTMNAVTRIQRYGYNEAYYSAPLEKILLLKSVPMSTKWAGMVLSARCFSFQPGPNYHKRGLYVITCFYSERLYWDMVIARDMYVRIR